MSTIQRFEDLEIWQRARAINRRIQVLLKQEPFSKDFTLVNQVKASAGSIMDNIVEGYERDSRNEFVHFLSISKGSAGELRSQLYRAYDCDYINKETLDSLVNELIKLSVKIQNFISYLNKSAYKGGKFRDRNVY